MCFTLAQSRRGLCVATNRRDIRELLQSENIYVRMCVCVLYINRAESVIKMTFEDVIPLFSSSHCRINGEATCCA